MSAIYFLIACSIIIAVIFLAAFFMANKSGQYEDTYTPSIRILFDESEEQTEGEITGQALREVPREKEAPASVDGPE